MIFFHVNTFLCINKNCQEMECADSKVSTDSIIRNKVSAVGTEKVSK